MDPALVTSSLISVLSKIQNDGGYTDGGTINGATVPPDDLDGFDSKLVPVAIKRLGRVLGVAFPKKVNIFCEGGRSCGRKLTVEEIGRAVASRVWTSVAVPPALAVA